MKEYISIEKIIEKLDACFSRNDYASAEKLLLSCLEHGENASDTRVIFFVQNELMGLYRKLGRRDDALGFVRKTLDFIEREGICHQLGAATALLNCATVYKAFDLPEDSLELFLRARTVYESALDVNDSRLGGLYNNMALTLVDLKRFDEARELYGRALRIAASSENGALDSAMTYLNLANAEESEYGLADADGKIQNYLELARAFLEGYARRDGYYAFVCEKCASVFLYYGHFAYAAELSERSRHIYENGGETSQ